MSTLIASVALVLLASLIVGLVPVFRGRAPADRMLAAQLTGTTTVAILVLLSQVMAMPALLDVALVFAMLAGVTLVCFVILASRGTQE
ncbi:MAG: pH regulation protein F [Salinarimonas sp.]|nr:pH regulation protein F [Salinarimonas sp.]